MKELFDYAFYARHFLKIRTKTDGMRPFIHRKYQKRFHEFLKGITGPKRVIVGKPRQCGFTTDVAGIFFHRMVTSENYSGIALADKKERTSAVRKVYKTFYEQLPIPLKPMVSSNNTERLIFDNPDQSDRKRSPGLGSEILFETGNDPNAGRSSPRLFAHISEAAFIRYMKEIDDGIQNSIPLVDDSMIIKESTGNGRAGIGKPFYDLYQSAKRGDSIYKPFFVGWFEVDDYAITPPSDFKPTKEELDILKREPQVTEANLVWRRLKIREYLDDSELSILTPDERFKQDFPLNDEEMFLSTGAPVFDLSRVNTLIMNLTKIKPKDIKDALGIQNAILKNHWTGLKIFAPPRSGKTYFIGADVSEGLAVGDSSTAWVIDESYCQVASFKGKIDPDIFGHLLIALGDYYNKALLIPECNNMGHTVVTTIRQQNYPKLYKEVVEDKVTKEIREVYGWRTTKISKMDMLNEGLSKFRDGVPTILDINLPLEMALVSREENGNVDLNGRDMVVAYCLALMGRRQHGIPISTGHKTKLSAELYDTKVNEAMRPKREKNDIFG